MEELFIGGHTACQGCAAPIIVRNVLRVLGKNTIVVGATGCLEVISTIYPNTSWKVPFIHGAFQNAAAIASGLREALETEGKSEINVCVFAGDGATFDIGMGALSGLLERGHKVIYVLYDNEAYSNTGVQRSSATPRFSRTTTTPGGKKERKKPIALVVGSHGDVYSATANPAFLRDLEKKVKKAKEFDGPSFLHILSPCPTGWRFDPSLTIEIAKLATETLIFPLYEIERGILRVTEKVLNPKPLEDYLKLQGRFKGMDPEKIKILEKEVKEFYDWLLANDGKRVFPF